MKRVIAVVGMTLAGFFLPWGIAVVFTPEANYEKVLGLMFLGALVGMVFGLFITRARGTGPTRQDRSLGPR